MCRRCWKRKCWFLLTKTTEHLEITSRPLYQWLVFILSSRISQVARHLVNNLDIMRNVNQRFQLWTVFGHTLGLAKPAYISYGRPIIIYFESPLPDRLGNRPTLLSPLKHHGKCSVASCCRGIPWIAHGQCTVWRRAKGFSWHAVVCGRNAPPGLMT